MHTEKYYLEAHIAGGRCVSNVIINHSFISPVLGYNKDSMYCDLHLDCITSNNKQFKPLATVSNFLYMANAKMAHRKWHR